MIHIVFNSADAEVLQQAIAMDETLAGQVIILQDDYALGPIENIYTKEGMEIRKNWWSSILSGGDFEKSHSEQATDDHSIMDELVNQLKENESEVVWIWAAQNKKDVSGYYWLLHFMKPFQGRVLILYLNNLPFINEKGNIFYPGKLSEIPAKEFIKAKKLAREITLSEFEIDPDEWNKLCSENKIVRILEGGKKLSQFDEHYYDSELKKYIMPDWQKANKIIHNFQTKSKQNCSESFLFWRLKAFIEQGLFDMQGKPANMKDFEIKYFSKAEQ
jgi:hypothetical protein